MDEDLVELHDSLNARVGEALVVMVVGHEDSSRRIFCNLLAYLVVVIHEGPDPEFLDKDRLVLLGQMDFGIGDAVPL